MAAHDRLFQLDLWRRTDTGTSGRGAGSELHRSGPHRAPGALSRETGTKNGSSYSPDTKQIIEAFTNGINAYIRSLITKAPEEFRLAGFDPGLWARGCRESRLPACQMTGNVLQEVNRALLVARSA